MAGKLANYLEWVSVFECMVIQGMYVIVTNPMNVFKDLKLN